MKHRRFRLVLSLILLAPYALIGLAPNGVPNLVRNHAELSSDNKLARFAGEGILRTAEAPPWVADAIAANAFEIRLRAKPYLEEQEGPARILTVSADTRNRNLDVGQDRGDLIVRMRTPDTNSNGMPAITIPDVFAKLEWRDIEVNFSDRHLAVSVDGAVAAAVDIPANALATWAPDYRMALGNELTHQRPWQGEIAVAEVTVDGNTTDLLAPDQLERPIAFRGRAGANRTLDNAVNFLGFIPLGLVIGLWLRQPGWRALALALIAISIVSAGIESAQLLLPSRYTSLRDIGLNTLGGGFGLLAAALILLRRRPPKTASV